MSSVGAIYDPRGHTWDSWSSLMCELYAAQGLESNCPETEWKRWAEGLKGIASFTAQGIPSPDGFQSWDLWAQELLTTLDAWTSQ
jgi:hypothetical protein